MGFNPAIHGALHASRMAAINNNHHKHYVMVSNQDTACQDSTKNEYHTSIQVDTQNPTGISPEGIGCICAISIFVLFMIITIIKDIRDF